MKLLLERTSHESVQTIGKLYLLRNNNSVINDWHSLELPWNDNKRNFSCIPEGVYKARVHKSPKFGKSLWLQDVPNRSEILIHKGNFHFNVRGCILIGTDLKDINKDGFMDVSNSLEAINLLMLHLEDVDGIMIEIKD